MTPTLTLLNALAAVYGSYLACHDQWLAGPALVVIPLFSVYALSLRRHPRVKRAGYFLNGVLVAIGAAYTVFVLSRLAGTEPPVDAGVGAFLREIWLSLWLLVLPVFTGWLLWTQENRIKAGEHL